MTNTAHRKIAQRLIKRRDKYASQNSTTRLYSTVGDVTTEIYDSGTTLSPKIQQISADRANRLFPSGDIHIEGQNIYEVRVLGNSLSNKQKYSISFDSGNTAFECKLYGIKINSTNTAQVLILGGKPNSVFVPPIIETLHTVSLSIANTKREIGDTSLVVLDWSVTKADYTITAITLTDVEIIVTGESQSNIDSVTPSEGDLTANKTYTLSATDTRDNIKTKSVTVTRSSLYYWGTYTGTILFRDEDLAALDGAGVGTGRDWFNGTLNRVFSGLTGSQEYFVFVFPVGKTVKFYDNAFGLEITGFIKIHDGNLNNDFGYPIPLQVWRSEFKQFGTSTDIRVEVS